MSERCDRCGALVAIGQWPFCPHDKVTSAHMQDDTIPGGARWMHNLGERPLWVETKTELRKVMQERGLEPADRASYNEAAGLELTNV